jgi:hypothetical protein
VGSTLPPWSYASFHRPVSQRKSSQQRLPTRHEKNVQRKIRVRAREIALGREFHSTPPQRVNYLGLRNLQRTLGLPSDPYLIYEEKARVEGFELESLDEVPASRMTLSSLPDGHFTESTEKLGAQKLELCDTIFVAIDFGFSHYSPLSGRSRLQQVGVSTLNTGDLYAPTICAEDIISTKHYRTRSNSKSFLFGDPSTLQRTNFCLFSSAYFTSITSLLNHLEILSLSVMGLVPRLDA